MSVPNFSFLACLEVSEKFVVGWCWFHVSTMSNLNPSKIEMELGLAFDKFLTEYEYEYIRKTKFHRIRITNIFINRQLNVYEYRI